MPTCVLATTIPSLFVNVAVFDRWLWYQESPTSQSLTNWDAVSLYLNTDGVIGDVPGAHTYRFDGQLTWWESVRTPWQAAYRGNGSGWVLAGASFTTTIGWQGNAPNDNGEDDRGWTIFYHIPFASLGLSGPPTHGALWGLGVVVHDRDNASGNPSIASETWPENMVDTQPRTWGQLHFGLPDFAPQSSVPRGTLTIRNKLNGAVVADAAVGGTMDNMCPGDSTYIWSQWADFKNPHDMQFNVQNQLDISDWPCFSKYFITFPMNAVPAGKSIISATLTLHQFGNAGQGWDPPPQPSFIQVLTIGSEWDEDTITWNNAPRARENIGGAWVDPLSGYGGDPGIPRQWDVSYAAAEAYAVGEPLRLALYSADWAYHSGRYFWSSDHDDYHPEARPTITLVWGEPVATVHNQVQPSGPQMGQQVTYTLSLLSNGRALTLTDNLPSQVSRPGMIQLSRWWGRNLRERWASVKVERRDCSWAVCHADISGHRADGWSAGRKQHSDIDRRGWKCLHIYGYVYCRFPQRLVTGFTALGAICILQGIFGGRRFRLSRRRRFRFCSRRTWLPCARIATANWQGC